MDSKLVPWVGSSREDLKRFPVAARRRAGHELDTLQRGLHPTDFKAMPAIGAGVHELRIRAGEAFRLFYVVRFEEAIYVLHAFQKRSRRTSRFDIDLGAKRYREVVSGRIRSRIPTPTDPPR
jgi:phage-related protein